MFYRPYLEAAKESKVTKNTYPFKKSCGINNKHLNLRAGEHVVNDEVPNVPLNFGFDTALVLLLSGPTDKINSIKYTQNMKRIVRPET